MCTQSRHKCPAKEYKKLITFSKKYDIEMATSVLYKYNPRGGFINQLKNAIYTEWLRIQIRLHSKKHCQWCTS